MAKSKPKAAMKIQVNEEMWLCQIWPAKQYEKMHGNDSYAITDPQKRIIDFNVAGFSMEVVAHELMHAYFKYLHLDSVDSPKIDNIEEIIASWIGLNLVKFYHKANAIYTNFEQYGVEE